MARVNTVRGPVDAAELGAVLMHEHLFLLSSPAGRAHPERIPDEGRRVGDAVDRLRRLKERGIDTLVDLTVAGAGRYLPRVQAVAARVDLHIIAAAGLFVPTGSAAARNAPGSDPGPRRDVHRGDPGGDRGDGGEGGGAQVRHRAARGDPRRGTGPAGDGAGAAGDGGADLHPHPCGQPQRARPVAYLRRGGGGSRPCRHRTLGRHGRSWVPGKTDGDGGLHRDGPVRHRPGPGLRTPGRHRGPAVPDGVCGENGAFPRRLLLQ